MEILINNQTDYKIDGMDKLLEDSIGASLDELDLPRDYEISVSLFNEDQIKKLNRDYRGVDSVTDVLSFPTFEKDQIKPYGLLGDIVICPKRAQDQAVEYGHSFKREISYLTVHSMLHLLGYDHIEEADRKEMRALEKSIMKRLGVFKNDRKEEQG